MSKTKATTTMNNTVAIERELGEHGTKIDALQESMKEVLDFIHKVDPEKISKLYETIVTGNGQKPITQRLYFIEEYVAKKIQEEEKIAGEMEMARKMGTDYESRLRNLEELSVIKFITKHPRLTVFILVVFILVSSAIDLQSATFWFKHLLGLS